MALERYEEQTTWVFFPVNGLQGTITSVHVYFDTDPNARPGQRVGGSWMAATHVPPTGHNLSKDNKPWIAVLVGPEGGDIDLPRVGGVSTDYQAWVALWNGEEFEVDKPGTISVV